LEPPIDGMTYYVDSNGNGVIYRLSLQSHQYSPLHTFSPTDAIGSNGDGANPGAPL
jgi:hypothetical protein